MPHSASKMTVWSSARHVDVVAFPLKSVFRGQRVSWRSGCSLHPKDRARCRKRAKAPLNPLAPEGTNEVADSSGT